MKRLTDRAPVVCTRFLFVAVACAASVTAGCTTSGAAEKKSAAKPKPILNQPNEVPRPEQTASNDPQALASVMDFLNRTNDYQQAPPGGTKAKSPEKTGVVLHHKPEIPTLIVPEDTASAAPPPAAAQPAVTEPAKANTQVALEGAARSAPPTVKSLRIRTADQRGNPAPEAGPLNATNQAMEVQAAGAGDAKAFLSALARKARTDAGFENEWSLRLAQVALHEPVEAGDISKSLPEEQRKLIADTAALLSAVRREASNPQLPGEEALLRAHDLAASLAQRADPVVTTIALCRRVVTFGVYEELPAVEFAAGRATPAIVYSEIKNLRSEPGSDGLYRSTLATRMELFTAAGASVWKHEEPDITDLCRNRRSDFFVAQRATFPATLQEGPHVLKVFVEDKLSGRTAEQSYRFNVGGALVKR